MVVPFLAVSEQHKDTLYSKKTSIDGVTDVIPIEFFEFIPLVYCKTSNT